MIYKLRKFSRGISRIKLISSLRNSTGASLKLCQNVVDKNFDNNDVIFLEREILKLSELSGVIKNCTSLNNGNININETNNCYLMFSLKCKTDFVAKCSNFIDYSSKIVFDDQFLINKTIQILSGIVQEPIEISPIFSWVKYPSYTIGTYIHNKVSPSSGSIGSMVKISFDRNIPTIEKQAIANDIALHISGMNPTSIEDLLNQKFLKCPNERTTKEYLKSKFSPTIIDFKRMSIK